MSDKMKWPDIDDLIAWIMMGAFAAFLIFVGLAALVAAICSCG